MIRFRRPPLVAPWMTVMAMILGVAALIQGFQYVWGPTSWHQTTAQQILHAIPVPLWVYGILYLIAGFGSLFPLTRAAGLAVGGIVYGCFAFALWEQEIFGTKGWAHLGILHGPAPSLATGASVVAAFYAFACRRALEGDPARNFAEAVDKAVTKALEERAGSE